MTYTRTTKGWLGVIGAVLLAGACGTHKAAMSRSDLVPAAEGKLKVKEADGGNSVVELKVKHLAPPDRIDGNAKNYVVWLRPLDGAGQPQNVGALAVGENLEAELETITAYDKFEVFVTPEPTEKATAPTGQRVLWSSIQ